MRIALLALCFMTCHQVLLMAQETSEVDRATLPDGPVKLSIEGDTSHLFSEEDFEKKVAVLLRPEDETNQATNSIEADKNTTTAVNETIICAKSNLTTFRDFNTVQLVNGSHLSHLLAESGPSDCFLVLFYASWCKFSARVAPFYNALPRAFPNLDILAFDVSKSIGYNTKFGTSAVPMIIIFKNKNALAKFNYTQKNLTEYIEFIGNKTGFKGNKSLELEESDLAGPVPTVPVERFDYILLISWIFVIFVALDLVIRKSMLRVYLHILWRIMIIGVIRLKEWAMARGGGYRAGEETNQHLDQPEAIPALMQSESQSTTSRPVRTNDYNYRPRRSNVGHQHHE